MDIFKETDFLYELDDRCGLIALSIDGSSPFYIVFKQSIKIELTSHDSVDKVMIMQAPLDSEQAPLVKAMQLQNSGHTCFAESYLNQALSMQDIDKLVKEKMAVMKEEKLERAIDRVNQKAVKTTSTPKATSPKHKPTTTPKATSPKHKHYEVTTTTTPRQVTPVTSKTLKEKIHEKLERNRRLLLENKGNKVIESTECGSSKNGIGNETITIKIEPDTDTTLPNIIEEIKDSDCEMSEEEHNASTTELQENEVIDCKHCFKTFNTKEEFFNHRRPKSEPQRCATCKKVFQFRGYLLVHMRQRHPIDGRPVKVLDVCDVCGKKLKNLNRLRQHMLIHTEEYLYKCCLCEKNLGGFGALNTHMASHKKGGIVKCTCCNKIFTSRLELSKHRQALLGFKCKLCGEALPNRTSRTVHYQTVHPDGIVTCSICNCIFLTDEELSNHMVYHIKNKKKQCTICGKFVARLERHLMTHKSLKDLDESELFMCDKCPMKFKIKDSLYLHQKLHSKEKSFKCSQCPKSFAQSGVLLKHIRRHSPLFPYKCDVCGKRYKEKHLLTAHMRIHTKDYPCPFCPQAFSYNYTLETHVKSKHAAASSEHSEPIDEMESSD